MTDELSSRRTSLRSRYNARLSASRASRLALEAMTREWGIEVTADTDGHLDSSWNRHDLEYIDEINENLLCPVCQVPFWNPRVLPCDHVFCRNCMKAAFEHQGNRKTCPTCRAETTMSSSVAASRLILRMLDDLRVKCPLESEGCRSTMTRGSVRAHLDKYCGYREIPCPAPECDQKIPRRLAQEECQHRVVHCSDCEIEVPLFSLPQHRERDCKILFTTCEHCTTIMSQTDFQGHVQSCPDKQTPCLGSEYGCDFKAKRSEVQDHNNTCGLARIATDIDRQSAQLAEHAESLRALRRTTAWQTDCLDKIREAVDSPSPRDDELLRATTDAPTIFGSPYSHLLSLHETLREQVDRVSTALTDLDAKTNTEFFNNSLRTNEENAHRDSAIAALRIQMQRLVSSKFQEKHMSRPGISALGTPSAMGRANSDDEPVTMPPLRSGRPGSDDEESGPGSFPNSQRLWRSDRPGSGGREKL